MENTQEKQKLSREAILEAALELADEGGLQAVSMRKVAARVGAEAMSLYNHIKNKEDLIDGIVDRVAARFVVPDVNGDWQEEMRKRAVSMHQVMMRHRWSPIPFVSRINTGPAQLRHVDATIGCLVTAGFTYEMADYAWNTLDSHIFGFTLKEISFPFEPEEFAEVAQRYQTLITEDKYPYLAGMSQAVMSGAHNGVQSVEFGLNIILEGLEAKRAAHWGHRLSTLRT
ncbi:TetR/AcrR family transcriptional regulator C-terminal domain-containing protein [Pseudoprimorskyibacter insulae]|uniref:Tetracycline repressor protein class H n=1 Tax=Pseudoprimorskyibacter insulae TaxID=1695997 RepID=A0A2R8APJ1_9RHOB|nr:TetR/AcrR family transcriptional regulator C-terminal domain-containing protein [Pseudoprimorskyibacter insulae]SPF77953.1 Tetracycline repressor protein class H [Pseudoprimorskyibacter insulae]